MLESVLSISRMQSVLEPVSRCIFFILFAAGCVFTHLKSEIQAGDCLICLRSPCAFLASILKMIWVLMSSSSYICENVELCNSNEHSLRSNTKGFSRRTH